MKIQDGTGSGNQAKVSKENHLQVATRDIILGRNIPNYQ